MVSPPPVFQPGTRLALRYLVRRHLGTGGIGTTWLVHDLLAARDVALKLLHHRAPDSLSALRREFTLLRGLVHPHLARVHDFGSLAVAPSEAAPFYTSDFIDGAPLLEFAHGRTFDECLGPIIDAVRGVAHLHRVGIRHGDVTPSNILVAGDGHATLIDLSCAVPLSAPPSDSVSGTPGYLAPELMRGAPADGRADLYSIGVSLHSLAAVLASQLPAHVQRLAHQCTRPDPRDRPPTASHVLDALGAPVYEPHALYLPPSNLVGRAREWTPLREALDALVAQRTAPRCLCVCGPEGVGRTRLLQELKWDAQLRCPVVEGSPRQLRPIQDMLSRALSGAPVDTSFRALLAACARLQALPSPLVLLVDDAHQLSDADQQALLAIARTVDPSGPVLLAWSNLASPSPLPSSAVSLELGPLAEDEVRAWAGDAIPARLVPRLREWTGGYPAALVATLSQMSAGALELRDLRASGDDSAWSARRAAAIAQMPLTQRRALALVAVFDEALPDDALGQLSLTLDSLSELTASGFVKRDDDGWRLVRAMESKDICRAVGGNELRLAHETTASWLQTRLDAGQDSLARGRIAPRLARQLTLAGQTSAAVVLLREGARDALRDPSAWRQAAEAVAESSCETSVLVLCADVLLMAGRPDSALALLERAEKQSGSEVDEAAVALAKASALLARGEAEQSLRTLSGWDDRLEHDPGLGPRAAVIRSRAFIHLGDAARAMKTAQQAYDEALPDGLRGELHDAMGVASSYLGDPKEAQRHLREAAALHHKTGHPDALVRTLSYAAFHAYRAGDAGVAERAYRDTREQVETHGFTDKLANAELNVGAACHQRGNWGEALGCYERGMQIAAALGQASHEVQARFNLAKLYADIGAADLAEPMIERGLQLAKQEGLKFFSSAFLAVRAEAATLRGQWGHAQTLFDQAAAEFDRSGSRRESLEVRLQSLEAMVAMGRIQDAASEFDRLQASGEPLDAPDLQAAAALVNARIRLAEGRAPEATSSLEEAVELARKADQPASRADIHRLFSQVWAHQRSAALSAREASLARELDERIAASLPETLRDTFWKHPKRRGTAPSPSQHTAPAHADKLRRLLDINTKLNSSLRTRDVLSRTMDAAVDLVGAERGFLILLEAPDQIDGKMTVPVARNLDKEQVGKRHLKFSRTIAEQCMAGGEPIVTTDAQVDGRFATNVSVHAMRLKSVVCVPIRSPAGTLGALYLDNRFQRGTFDAEDIEILSAFGNQAALALTNARLHDELRRRTRELEHERARVQELMLSQAAEINRLTDEVRTTREVLEHRYDYSNIVGRSRRMQQVLATLDRVIDSDVPVLILGESGTGKELIAKALHLHGSRRARPFVAINCAAVPQQLLESELFGHVRGAYTGADRDHDGLFVSARGGTVLLDEIGDMPLEMQAKLLRVLQEGEVRPLGATRSKRVDFRLACATNRDLAADAASGRFRQDLYYRINVVPLTLPPLRDRREDIPELAHYFLEQHARKLGRPVPRLDREALQTLLRHGWPGNVRELENTLLQAVLLCESDRLRAADVQPTSRAPAPAGRIRNRGEYRQAEEDHIRDALVANRWNVSLVARELGVSRPTLYRKMRQYGIHAP